VRGAKFSLCRRKFRSTFPFSFLSCLVQGTLRATRHMVHIDRFEKRTSMFPPSNLATPLDPSIKLSVLHFRID
jgi:hypothetical protein